MAIKTTTWGPDTCSCRVTFQWDDEVPSDLRIHTQIAVESKGPEHAAIVDGSLYQTLLGENRRKNLTFGIARAELARPDNDPVQWYSWSFTPGRVLEVSFISIVVSNAVKQRIQNACDLQFGPGTVVVN